MGWIGWAALYTGGAAVTAAFNVGSLVLSGGIVTRPSAIIRNAVIWPLMLPFLIVDWVANG
jgi:hypothetical protein